MYKTLTTALMASAAVAMPAANTHQTCTDKSVKVTDWTIHNFDFHASYTFTTPAHQNSWGYVNFTLENPTRNYRAVCSRQSGQLQDFFYGLENYNCTQPDGSWDLATFNYSRPSGALNINQTWICDKDGSEFWAEGGIDLKLKCNEKNYKNPHWKMGQIYSSRTITCDKVTTKVPIKSLRAAA